MQKSIMSIDEATGRYLPYLYPEEMPYWNGLKEHKLVLQRCNSCGKAWFPIGPTCMHCFSFDHDWDVMSGKGVIHNYVVYHKPWMPWLEKRVPYAVVSVEIEEGPRLTTNLLEVPSSEVKIGMPVEAAYEKINDKITLLQFRPRKA